MKTTIPLIDLVTQYQSIETEINAAIHRVLISGQFILGSEVAAFEQEVASYIGVQHGVGVASGTDALIIALRALGIGAGDEVIVPAYTFFATVGAVLHVGATPVFCDIDPKTYCMDVQAIQSKITSCTKGIIPVHLYGHPADMHSIMDIAREYKLKVIEDNAQAFGSLFHGKKTGSFGHVACLSFFPTKNLGGYGDGGMVVTYDGEIAERVRMLRAHGWKRKYYPELLGYNSRLDALQSAILRVKLAHVDEWNSRRRLIAAQYNQGLAGLGIQLPYTSPESEHVFHLYTIRVSKREHFREALRLDGIASDVYYPQPPYLSRVCDFLGHQPDDFPVSYLASQETLTIPLYPEMDQAAIETIINTIRQVSRNTNELG
jgi:dTDP-4-amino-4,6-dideoxygalactose transaminase